MSFAANSAGALRAGTLRRRLLRFVVVAGPGIIVMVADNEAGAVSTYTQAGAQYGTALLWTLLALLPVTYFVQEMVARLGIATGQGHAAMIYQRFGTWWGRFSLVDLMLLNFLTLVTEFAAVAMAARAAGIAPAVAVPLAAAGLILMVGSGSYRRWERLTLVLCLFNLAWFALAFLARPDWLMAARDTVAPHMPAGGLTGSLVFLVIAIVGTTIAPWQLFFQQSCTADKRLRFADLGAARMDTFLGAVAMTGFAGCMMLVGGMLYRHGIGYADPAQMAGELGKLIGPAARWGVLLLMVNAAVLGATTISLSSAWAWGEALGRPNSLEAKLGEAPQFYAAYAVSVAAAAGLVLIPGAPLQKIILGVQVLSGVMLPSAIVFLQLLLNDRELLGERFANKAWNNWVNWSCVGVLVALSLVLAVQVLLPGLFPAAS